MKRSARFISVLVAMLLLLTTLATGVFATEDLAPANEPAAVEVTEPEVPEVDSNTVEINAEGEGVETEVQGEDVVEVKRSADVQLLATVSGTTATVTVSGEDATDVKNIVPYKGEAAETPVSATISASGDKVTVNNLSFSSKYVFKAYGDQTTGDPYAVSNEVVTDALATPTGVAAYPSFHSVWVVWNASNGAASYEITRNDGVVYNVAAPTTSFRDTNNAADTTYSYTVKAVAADKTTKSVPSAAVAAARVRTCYYRITFKKAVKLTSHDGTKTKNTFKKGQVVYADGFAQGMYQFNYNGHRYHAKWMRIKSPKGEISKNAYENGFTAEHYVNESGYGSATGWLVWINIYSQRVYLFTGSAGNWKLYDSWQCGTGSPKTPTPTGMNKKLHKKMKKYSRHKYWNCFSGTNAIHGSNGQKELKKLGRQISNGCVRVTNAQALWMLNTVPKKTRFLVF